MVWLALVTVANAATPEGCAEATPVSTWSEALDGVETAFGRMDAAGFDAGMHRAALDLPCLGGPLPPVQAARWHRLVALRLYARGDEAGARLALAAARAADPYGVVPAALLPAGHEARAIELDAVGLDGVARARPPRRGDLVFDGQYGLARPTERPVVCQLVVDGEARRSTYLAPGQPLPPYAATVFPPAVRLGLGGVGLGLAAGSVALAVEALADDAPAPALGVAAAVGGGLALGGLTLAIVPW